MQLDPLGSKKIDEKSAQEALTLAVRLQSESGNHITIEELKSTAQEAGIDQAYVEEALRQIEANKSAKKEKKARTFRFIVGVALLSLIIAFCIASIFVNFNIHAPTPFVFVIVLFVSMKKMRKYRDS